MSDELVRHGGDRIEGPARTSPYPTSRLAPPHDLVDVARQIAEADRFLGTVVQAELELVATQIRRLQDDARRILADAVRSAALHRAECRFLKRVGQVYHLYERPETHSGAGIGRRYFSLLSPSDWNAKPPHVNIGSYRLGPDMRWREERADRGTVDP